MGYQEFHDDRIACGLTRWEMALILMVPHAHIYAWEMGKLAIPPAIASWLHTLAQEHKETSHEIPTLALRPRRPARPAPRRL